MQIIPRAVDYFTGKALEYEGYDEDDDFEDLDDEDDDDEDRFDDVRKPPSLDILSELTSAQEDESDDDVPARRRGPPKRGGASDNVNPDECKQQ